MDPTQRGIPTLIQPVTNSTNYPIHGMSTGPPPRQDDQVRRNLATGV